jgi:hypothetical protein
MVYGEFVSNAPSEAPSKENWTDAMPTVEVGIAVKDIVLVTTAPLGGVSMRIETPVALTVNITGSDCGLFVAPAAAIVAVAL